MYHGLYFKKTKNSDAVVAYTYIWKVKCSLLSLIRFFIECLLYRALSVSITLFLNKNKSV